MPHHRQRTAPGDGFRSETPRPPRRGAMITPGRRGCLSALLLATALAAGLPGAAAADEPQASAAAAWRVGVARAVITPDTPVWLAGYGTKREPDGKLHDVWAKALAFEAADGGRAVLIASDFQGVPASMSDRVFARLAAEHHLDRSRVIFAYSHNHSSPRLGDDLIDEKLEAGETFATAYPYPLHAWRLGDTLLVGMGGETVVDYALRFKRQWGAGTWVLGYTDDMAAYIPSRRVWEEGGYEGGAFLYEYGRPAFRWAGTVEERVAAAVAALVDEVGPPPAAGGE